jgi:hypothetical protein
MISKRGELEETMPWKFLQDALDTTAPSINKSKHDKLRNMVKLCLWANKADGCYQEVKQTVSGAGATLAVEEKYLLVDHSDHVIQHLEKIGNDIHVNFINDNCGTELLMDLALADHLLSHVSARPRSSENLDEMLTGTVSPPDTSIELVQICHFPCQSGTNIHF